MNFVTSTNRTEYTLKDTELAESVIELPDTDLLNVANQVLKLRDI
jgi:hypothetical protein